MLRNFIVRFAGAAIRNMPLRLARFCLSSSGFLKRIGLVSMAQKDLSGIPDLADQRAIVRDVTGRCGSSVIYLEFGVHRGESFRIAMGEMSGKAADFFGFDSFTGLPDDWSRYFGNTMAAGTFDTGGEAPDIQSDNVAFVKGWFEDTLPDFLRTHPMVADQERDVVLYLDADLHHPTLFVLHRIAAIRDRFLRDMR